MRPPTPRDLVHRDPCLRALRSLFAMLPASEVRLLRRARLTLALMGIREVVAGRNPEFVDHVDALVVGAARGRLTWADVLGEA